jgi:transcription initiation factor TFIIB
MISDPESGETICSSCGQVLSDKAVETGAEWRSFGGEMGTAAAASRIRAGGPISLARHDMGLATAIGNENTDASGALLGPAVLSAIGRWRTWDSRVKIQSSSERNLQQAFGELGRLKTRLNLSDAIVEKTAYIYRKARERHLTRGRSILALVGASIYISSRELGSPLSLKDVTEHTGLRRNNLTRMYRIVLRELDLKIPMPDPVRCIIKIASRAGLSEKTKRQAVQIMDAAIKKEKGTGKNPLGFAASVLYMTCLTSGEPVSQKTLAEASGVTEATIRNRLKDLRQDPQKQPCMEATTTAAATMTRTRTRSTAKKGKEKMVASKNEFIARTRI